MSPYIKGFLNIQAVWLRTQEVSLKACFRPKGRAMGIGYLGKTRNTF